MDYLKVWCSFRELLEPLNESERGRLFTAMLEYAETGKAPELKGNERYVWPAAKQSIDNTREKSEQMRSNRIKTEQTPTNENKSKQNASKPNKPFDKEKDKVIIKDTLLTESTEKRTRFSPPSVEEVDAYCKERGNKINAQTFVDFYASKGWRVGNNPMKDWKACVRTWEQRDNSQAGSSQKPRLLRSQDYHQREYNEAEMEEALGVRELFEMPEAEFQAKYGRTAK